MQKDSFKTHASCIWKGGHGVALKQDITACLIRAAPVWRNLLKVLDNEHFFWVMLCEANF